MPGLDAATIEQARDLPIGHQPRQLTHPRDRYMPINLQNYVNMRAPGELEKSGDGKSDWPLRGVMQAPGR